MKISVDTKEDSHDDIRKVIKMLQHLVGDSQEVFTNQPEAAQEMASPIANIFGDTDIPQPSAVTSETTQQTQETSAEPQEQASESTEDLFAELFNEEELKKMEATPAKE
ncbi:hypothetical protein HYX04_04655, partial [Candidatus Woesearchaeota archaeon]|nr:hypothetical protein [Candidatus Woesearchaeota archaeon]